MNEKKEKENDKMTGNKCKIVFTAFVIKAVVTFFMLPLIRDET